MLAIETAASCICSSNFGSLAEWVTALSAIAIGWAGLAFNSRQKRDNEIRLRLLSNRYRRLVRNYLKSHQEEALHLKDSLERARRMALEAIILQQYLADKRFLTFNEEILYRDGYEHLDPDTANALNAIPEAFQRLEARVRHLPILSNKIEKYPNDVPPGRYSEMAEQALVEATRFCLLLDRAIPKLSE